MTRFEALEAVAVAAQTLIDGGGGPKHHANWNALAIALSDYRAIPAEPLAAMPFYGAREPIAAAPQPQGETVTLAVWEGDEGDMRFVRASSHADRWPPPWRRLGTVTLPLDRERGE